MTDTCPNCGEEYQVIGKHFRFCGYPNLSEKQKNVMKGCLMGDATVDNRNIEERHPRFVLTNTNPGYATHVHRSLQPFATFRLAETAHKRKYLVSVTHPWVNNLADWYSTGEKVFPELSLNPTILKNWFCCDGCKQLNSAKTPRFHISIANECERTDKLERMFEDIGISVSTSNNDLYCSHGDMKPYEFMGEPPRGMKYKWP